MDLAYAALRAAEGMSRVHDAPPPRHAAQQEQGEPETVDALPPGITGAMILDDARKFAGSVLHATDEMLDALVLAAAVTHTIDSFTTVPRLLATSPEGQSGKSTLLKVLMMLGNNAWKSKPTQPGLRSKFNEREKPFVVVDEIADVYGRNGLRAGPPDLNTILREGYERDATLSLSNDRVTEDIPCYCVAAMGGLRNAVPNDIWTRCVEWKMKPVPVGVTKRDALDDDTQVIGKREGARIHQWARLNEQEIKVAFRDMRRPHRKFRSRLRQIWGPLYAVALIAGDSWPDRCTAAFRAMALDASEEIQLSSAQLVLKDTAAWFERTGQDKAFARDIRDHLRTIPDVAEYERTSDKGFAMLMTEALGPSQSMDIGDERAKGYHARSVLADWRRLEALLEPADEDDEEPDEWASMFEVTQITHVTDAEPEMAGA